MLDTARELLRKYKDAQAELEDTVAELLALEGHLADGLVEEWEKELAIWQEQVKILANHGNMKNPFEPPQAACTYDRCRHGHQC